MKLFAAALLLVFATTMASAAEIDGFGPWKFGMTKEQVAGKAEQGPYQPVKQTGGLETKNGKWDGEQKNISFLFEGERLGKIQIWVYEGQDEQQALAAWAKVAKFLKANFGPIEFPGNPEVSPDATDGVLIQAFQEKLKAAAEIKFQMGPKEMPHGATVFSSLFKAGGNGYYYVFLYYRKA